VSGFRFYLLNENLILEFRLNW